MVKPLDGSEKYALLPRGRELFHLSIRLEGRDRTNVCGGVGFGVHAAAADRLAPGAWRLPRQGRGFDTEILPPKFSIISSAKFTAFNLITTSRAARTCE